MDFYYGLIFTTSPMEYTQIYVEAFIGKHNFCYELREMERLLQTEKIKTSLKERCSYMKNLLIIDGNSIVNRAFYGIKLLTNKFGLFTNGIYGFLKIMFL